MHILYILDRRLTMVTLIFLCTTLYLYIYNNALVEIHLNYKMMDHFMQPVNQVPFSNFEDLINSSKSFYNCLVLSTPHSYKFDTSSLQTSTSTDLLWPQWHWISHRVDWPQRPQRSVPLLCQVYKGCNLKNTIQTYTVMFTQVSRVLNYRCPS